MALTDSHACSKININDAQLCNDYSIAYNTLDMVRTSCMCKLTAPLSVN